MQDELWDHKRDRVNLTGPMDKAMKALQFDLGLRNEDVTAFFHKLRGEGRRLSRSDFLNFCGLLFFKVAHSEPYFAPTVCFTQISYFLIMSIRGESVNSDQINENMVCALRLTSSPTKAVSAVC